MVTHTHVCDGPPRHLWSCSMWHLFSRRRRPCPAGHALVQAMRSGVASDPFPDEMSDEMQIPWTLPGPQPMPPIINGSVRDPDPSGPQPCQPEVELRAFPGEASPSCADPSSSSQNDASGSSYDAGSVSGDSCPSSSGE